MLTQQQNGYVLRAVSGGSAATAMLVKPDQGQLIPNG